MISPPNTVQLLQHGTAGDHGKLEADEILAQEFAVIVIPMGVPTSVNNITSFPVCVAQGKGTVAIHSYSEDVQLEEQVLPISSNVVGERIARLIG